jgi:hypothetical protein
MNFAAVVGASLRSSSALLRDAPTTAYYNVNRQRLHLSRAKHCLDEASHLFASDAFDKLPSMCALNFVAVKTSASVSITTNVG